MRLFEMNSKKIILFSERLIQDLKGKPEF